MKRTCVLIGIIIAVVISVSLAGPRDDLWKQVDDAISKGLEKDFAERGIALEKVLLRNISLPAKVKNAIEVKLEAEQEAQKMEFVLQSI